jgi:hypothetical protein
MEQTTVPRSMNRVMPCQITGINDNTSSIAKEISDLQCEVSLALTSSGRDPGAREFLGIASASGFSRQPDWACNDNHPGIFI